MKFFRRLNPCLFVCGVLACSLFLAGCRLFSSSASAATFVDSWTGERSFWVYADGHSTIEQVWNSTGSTTSLLGAGSGRAFGGYRFGFNVNRPAGMKRYWSLKLEYHINIGYNYWMSWDTPYNQIPTVLDVDGRKGVCSSSYNNVAILVTCTIAGDSMDYVPTHILARFGELNPPVWYLTSDGSGSSQAITLSYVNYDINSTNDPEVDILNQQTLIMEDQKRIQQEQLDYLTDDTPPSVDASGLADAAGWLPAGPVDSILTIPITFLNGIISALGRDTCIDVTLPLPFLNKNINLPCLRPILNDMGFLTIYNVVGGVVSMFVIYETLKWLYKFVDDTLSFRDNNNTTWGGL